jgi:inhibitor of KinA sporulation pathway (predicted exonuclease)
MNLAVPVRGSCVLRYVHHIRPYYKPKQSHRQVFSPHDCFVYTRLPERNNILSDVCYKFYRTKKSGSRAKTYCCDGDYDMMMLTMMMMIMVKTATTTLSCLFDASGTLLAHPLSG